MKIGTIIKTNLKVLSLLGAFYLGYEHRDKVGRLEDSVLNYHVDVERGYFKDSTGLEIYRPVNKEGKKEVYLWHKPTNTKLEIGEDMLPSTDKVLELMVKRSYKMNKYQAKETLAALNKIEEALYKRF